MKKRTMISFIGCLLLMQGNVFAQSANAQTSLEYNKKLVLDFYQKVFGDKDLSDIDNYLLPTYIQHNPNVADGAAAFKKAAEGWLKNAPKSKIDVQHIAAENDLVFLHIKKPFPDGKLQSVVDIFRIENGKIAEHWDVHENVPEKSANPHPMF